MSPLFLATVASAPVIMGSDYVPPNRDEQETAYAESLILGPRHV